MKCIYCLNFEHCLVYRKFSKKAFKVIRHHEYFEEAHVIDSLCNHLCLQNSKTIIIRIMRELNEFIFNYLHKIFNTENEL